MGKINLKAEDNHTLSTEKSNKKWLLEELYQTYGRKLYGYATTSWKLDKDTSWELIYKTLYKVIDTQEQYHFDHENKLAAFIFRVFINHLRNYYRDNKKLSERLHLIRMEDEDVEQIVDKDMHHCRQQTHDCFKRGTGWSRRLAKDVVVNEKRRQALCRNCRNKSVLSKIKSNH